MTNGWVDIKNTDMMLIMGGNPAENHPCGFKWAIEAKRTRNAKMIVVDPRFTRTASVADLFLQIRAGADIAFLGGLIRYALENNRIAKDYVLNYTNAAYIVKDDFKLPEDEGVFSGFDQKTQTYDKSTWNYARVTDRENRLARLTWLTTGGTSPDRRPCTRAFPSRKIRIRSLAAKSELCVPTTCANTIPATHRKWSSGLREFRRINS